MKGLLIFIKNPILGKAKTRLAKTIGNEKALKVYLYLLKHSKSITKDLAVDKLLYYAWEIDQNDDWDENIYMKYLQNQSNDLGVKMLTAFEENFKKGYQQLIIIGSDCFDLNEKILKDAFISLDSNDAVIGPAKDGGYYLIGFNKAILSNTNVLSKVFQNKDWSHENVAKEALESLKLLGLKYYTLPILSDVDTIDDLKGELAKVAGLQN